MGLQPSASRTAQLLECTRPFAPDTEVDPDPAREPGRYGTAFHLVLAAHLRAKKPLSAEMHSRAIDRAAETNNVKSARHELAGHVKSSAKYLQNWLAHQKLVVVEVEKAYAVNPATIKFRPIEPHDERHHYDCAANELPGTVDLKARSEDGRRILVLDHKTGEESHSFELPAKNPQMRSLGLMTGSNEVAVFHADRRGLPMIYAEEWYPPDAKSHAKALAKAFARIGDGWLHPGPWCNRCLARDDCPAKAADMLSEGTAALVQASNVLAEEPINPKGLAVLNNSTTLAARAAALYTLLKRFRAVERLGSDEIKRYVRAGGVVETLEGVLEICEQSFETVSKKSIMTSLGRLRGERELARLRKLGATATTKREILMPRK